jgi:membrane protein
MADVARRTRVPNASGFADDWQRLRQVVSRRGARRFLHDWLEALAVNDLFTYASAISFRVLFALVPLLLAGVAVLGFFRLENVYRDQVAPEIESRVSSGAYDVINAAVQEVIGSGSGFWLTLGVALAVWELSGAMRAIMGSLNRVYRAEEHRSFVRRLGISFLLAFVTSVALGFAIVTLQLGPDIADRIGLDNGVAVFFARWLGAAVLMILVVLMLIRFAPARHQRRSLVSVSAVLVTIAWIVTSLVFNWYTTTVATYRSIFGSLSIVIVLMTYLYVSALTFLCGVQMDALLRGYARGATSSARRRAARSPAS